MIKVKVCGMQSAADVDICLRAGVDALGFIFADSPRRLDLKQAAALSKLVPPFVTKVGVFASNSPELVCAAVERCQLDLLQFSGGEAPEFCGAFGKPTVMVMHAGGPAHPPSRHSVRIARAVALMVDSRVAMKTGGTGIAVAYDVAERARRSSSLPFILAGGLTATNVARAVKAVRPWAVDVRSGVERFDRKDALLVQRFVAAAKRGDR